MEVIGKGTIGFTVGKLMTDGQVPLLIPYVRTQEGKKSGVSNSSQNQAAIVGFETFELETLTTIVVFFDNTFSWINAKNVKYNITVENFSENSNLGTRPAVIIRNTRDVVTNGSVNGTEEGDVTELEGGVKAPTNVSIPQNSQNCGDESGHRDDTVVVRDDPYVFENEVSNFLEVCKAELIEIEFSVLTLCRN